MPIFPAGPRIAVSRVMAIGIMVVFLLIMITGGLIIWSSRSQAIHPFLVTVDELTGAWQVVGHSHDEKSITQIQALQESVVANFTRAWFSVSTDATKNDLMWAGYADKTECQTNRDNAQIFCNSGEDLYNYFIYKIVPDYINQADTGDVWSVTPDDIYVQPMADLTDKGGTWIIKTNVYSTTFGYIPIIAYATVGNNMELYPQNMGFYVVDFDAYRI